MRTILGLFALCLALTTIGCGSSISINTDFDPDANFSNFTTYSWVPQPATAVGDAQTAEESNTLLDQRIKAAVNMQMTRKGFTLTGDSPDIMVVYHTGVQNKLDVTDWGYSYGSYYYGYPQRDITVYQYQTGTLIVDMIEVSTKSLVWRGSAQATLAENPTPKQTEQKINAAVGRMFEQYPPKK